MRGDCITLIETGPREQDAQRLEQRNAYLEGKLKLEAQHHQQLEGTKQLITLRQQLAEKKPVKRR